MIIASLKNVNKHTSALRIFFMSHLSKGIKNCMQDAAALLSFDKQQFFLFFIPSLTRSHLMDH